MFTIKGIWPTFAGIEKQYRSLFEEERKEGFAQASKIICFNCSLPVTLAFWIADWFYVPHLAPIFFGLRLLIIPSNFISIYFITKAKSLRTTEWIATCYVASHSLIITTMIFMIGDHESPYYAGLTLIAIGGLPFLPWRPAYIPIVSLAIFGPYLIYCLFMIASTGRWRIAFVELFFVFSSILISIVGAIINERWRTLNFKARIALEESGRALDEKSQQFERALEKMSEQASQVAHDIRSPLMALNVAMSDPAIQSFPADGQKLITASVKRIREIAENLLHKYKMQSSESLIQNSQSRIQNLLLAGLIESIVWEKRVQHRAKKGISIHWDIDATNVLISARVIASEFKRAIANLLENAVEAIDTRGYISVNLSKITSNGASEVRIQITDNGRGIPEGLLSRVGKKGFTFGKALNQSSGHGLGLHQAESTFVSLGGKLAISSHVGKGTTIDIILPASEKPTWLVECFPTDNQDTKVIIDDDSAIHLLIDRILIRSADASSRLHIHSGKDAQEWLELNQAFVKEAFFFVDYQLERSSLNGLDLILKHSLRDRAILLSSLIDDESVFQKCEAAGIKFMPKKLLQRFTRDV